MRRILTLLLPLFLLAPSCREEEYVDFSEEEPIGGSAQSDARYTGLYLLNEGNMGSNHCTLDYLDLQSSIYHRNIYGQRNPTVVKELGDVGNDIQIYGSRLWMVINSSNKVEVAEATTAKRLGQVDIPNCRYITFHEGFAYVSSYVGPIDLSGDAQRGRIYKVDTLTLQKVDSVVVGYQPEEMAIIGQQLFVANSGGYRKPDYDNRLSCIDLQHFTDTPQQTIVGINLHRLVADRYGKLWVSSRGDYAGTPGALYCLATDEVGEMQIIDRLEIPVAAMQLTGDTLWYLASTWDNTSGQAHGSYGLIDVQSRQQLSTQLFDAPEISAIDTPYGLIVHPENRDFYLMDARNYVSSGQLLHFLSDGTFDWSVRTGDIPSRAVFVKGTTAIETDTTSHETSSLLTVLEYRPAPGQFVNTLPLYEAGDNAATMARKCTEELNLGNLITLGGFGGSVTFRFEQPVVNLEGCDFCIFGNGHAGSSEPGIVEVSADSNGNGLPDDPWYELAGSADTDSIGMSRYGYQISYESSPMSNIPWSDNLGRCGYIARNAFHTQEYFPEWLESPLLFEGTCLPDNGYDLSGNGTNWQQQAYRFGYVDNLPGNDPEQSGFDLDWAVDPISRKPVTLKRIHFIRVYTAVNQSCGWLGETSTEISGAKLINK